MNRNGWQTRKERKAAWRANRRTRTNGGRTGRVTERVPRPH